MIFCKKPIKFNTIIQKMSDVEKGYTMANNDNSQETNLVILPERRLNKQVDETKNNLGGHE